MPNDTLTLTDWILPIVVGGLFGIFVAAMFIGYIISFQYFISLFHFKYFLNSKHNLLLL